MNTDKLLTRLRDDIGEETAGMFLNNQLLRYLNRAYQSIFGEQVLLHEDRLLDPFDIDIVSGTSAYDLPADMQNLRTVKMLYNGEYYVVKQIDLNDVDNFNALGSQGLYPFTFRYHLLGSQIVLVPTPAESKTSGLRLYYVPTAGELHKGTASDGGLTSITLEGTNEDSTLNNPASDEDDAYNNMYIKIISGTGIGQKVLITDYAGSTRVATAAFSTAPDNTSVYAIIPKTEKQYDNAIIATAAAMVLRRSNPGEAATFDAEAAKVIRKINDEVDSRDRSPKYVRMSDFT